MWLQLVGHHASLPLALLILYQDFRFALADIFLKRAFAFILLAGLTFAVFAFGAALTSYVFSRKTACRLSPSLPLTINMPFALSS
jgi:hypothetical protein